MEEQELRTILRQKLGSGQTHKILRFLIGSLGGTPFIGGAIGASAAAWSETEQAKINALIECWLRILDERIDEIDKELVVIGAEQQWVAARVTFNPNKAEFVGEQKNVLSLTDHGYLDFSVNFVTPLRLGFTLQYYGSGEVRLNGVIEERDPRGSVRIKFLEPCPDQVTFVFFNLD